MFWVKACSSCDRGQAFLVPSAAPPGRERAELSQAQGREPADRSPEPVNRLFVNRKQKTSQKKDPSIIERLVFPLEICGAEKSRFLKS